MEGVNEDMTKRLKQRDGRNIDERGMCVISVEERSRRVAEEGRKREKVEKKRRKENEACLVHPLWGPDRYEGARG